MHSAGILALDFERVVDGLASKDSYRAANPSERLRLVCSALAEEPLLHDPGSDFLYAVQFVMLGRILEVAGGRSLEELVHQLILEPCGMCSTFFRVPSSRV